MKIFTIYFILVVTTLTRSQGQGSYAGLLNHAVLINIGSSSGSGVILKKNNFIYLVTAKHVLVDPKTNTFHGTRIEFIAYDSKYEAKLDTVDRNNTFIDVKQMIQLNAYRLTLDRDLVVIKIGELSGNTIKYFPVVVEGRGTSAVSLIGSTQCILFKDVKIGYDTYVAGFPSSLDASKYLGVSQFNFSTPLMRKGIIAGKNFDRRLIVLDCPVFSGNSGGPVFQVGLLEPAKLIGVVIEYIPMVDEWKSTKSSLSHIYTENSGYSLVEPLDEILKLVDLFQN